MRNLLQNAAAALMAYGPWGVFLLALVDSVGIPLPAALDALLLGVAASSVQSPKTAYTTALLAVVGSVAGNIALFLAAREGRRMFRRREPGSPGGFERWFQCYGLMTVFIPAVIPFLPLPLKVFVISAGACRTSIRTFVALIVTARLIRYLALAYLGLQLGLDAKGFLVRNSWTLIGVSLAMTIGLYLWIRATDRRRQSAM